MLKNEWFIDIEKYTIYFVAYKDIEAMKQKQLLTEGNYLLEKFSGKGGWTYALIPEVPQKKTIPFGWRRVSANIDGLDMGRTKLMPNGNGQLFLPVKAAIRKKIKKEAGDTAHIILHSTEIEGEIPQEIIDCLIDAGQLKLEAFQQLSVSQQKTWLEKIYDAQDENTKAQYIIELIEHL